MNQHLLSALKKELENSFGRKIVSSRDCLQLVEDIYQKTGYSINANTLRRFFGLVKTAYSASPSTVIILSKYCGFGSIDEIVNISSGDAGEEYINKEEVMHYLISLFKHMDPQQGYNPVTIALVRQTILFLERNRFLIDRFQREVAKTTAGLYYYYELGVNMDSLNDYYGNGLRHYLRVNTTNEARLFAHSILVFRYWLTENTALMEKHMAELSAVPVHHNYASHILGRLIAAKIYYAHTRSESTDKILTDASRYHVAIMTARSNSGPSYPDFELAVAEALILTGQQEEAREYIRRGKSFYAGLKGTASDHPFSFWETIINPKKILAMPVMDSTRKQPQRHVHSANYPLNKRYDALVQLLHTSGKSSQVAALAAETGFTRFQRLYTRKVENL